MKIKYIILLVLFTGVLFTNIFAQSASLGLSLGFPEGDFKDNVKRTGFGITGNFNIFDSKPGLPFCFGINVGYMNYGNENRREYFSSTIPDVYVDVDRSNNIVNFNVLFQVMPYKGNVRPYLEGLFGGSYLFTETKITSVNSNDEIASSTNLYDFAWNYGGGAGLLVNLISEPTMPNIGQMFLDIKVRYLFGTEAKYLKPGSVTISHGRAYYDISKSKTDLITFTVGVTAHFNSIGGN